MKTCDICGETSGYTTELFSHLASREVKTLCYTCAEIVGKFCDEISAYAESKEKALIRALQARVDQQRKEQIRSRGHWLAVNLRAWFQKRTLHQSFEIGVKKAPPSEEGGLPHRHSNMPMPGIALDTLNSTLEGSRYISLELGEAFTIAKTKDYSVVSIGKKLAAVEMAKQLAGQVLQDRSDACDVLVVRAWPVWEQLSDRDTVWMNALWVRDHYLVKGHYSATRFNRFSCSCPV